MKMLALTLYDFTNAVDGLLDLYLGSEKKIPSSLLVMLRENPIVIAPHSSLFHSSRDIELSDLHTAYFTYYAVPQPSSSSEIDIESK